MFRPTLKIIPISKTIIYRANSNFTSVLGRKFESRDELDTFFNESTWSTNELLQKEALEIDINNSILDRLLELSGLSKSISSERKIKIIQSLTEQLNFITKLHNIEVPNNLSTISRLVDDKSVETLDYDTLIDKISKTIPELSKGEIEHSWSPLSLTQEHQNKYYLVKEGLLKKNK
jgi:hypothetical protein